MASCCKLMFVLLVIISYIANVLSGMQENNTERSKAPVKPFEWIDPLSYLDNVTSVFDKRVREFWVGNLPVPDKVYDVNTTRYNIHLLGSQDFYNGFVMRIQDISRHPRDFIWYIDKNNSAIIQFVFVMTNVSVFYDVRVDLDVLETRATAVLVFPINQIQVMLHYDLKSHEAGVLSMSTLSVSGPKTRFFPNSPEMEAIAYNARLTMSSSLFSDLTRWIKYPFKPILETIVRQKAFPLKVGGVRRRPSRRISDLLDRRRFSL